MNTLTSLVERINSESGTDSTGGFDTRSAEVQAAEYALQAWDADYDKQPQIETHLEFLAEAGAIFDTPTATQLAMS